MPNLKTVDLGNLAADGSTDWYQIKSADKDPVGAVHIRCTGDFGGGTLTIEGSLDGSTAYGLGDNASLTAAGGVELKVLVGEYIRATIAGATSPDVDTTLALPQTAN